MKSKNLNSAIHDACKQSGKGCSMRYVVERNGEYIVCTEDELFDEYDQDQVIGCAFNGRWE